MSARKNQHVAFDGAHAMDNAIRPRADLFRKFSVRAAVTEQIPVGSFCTNLYGADTFVITVIPFDQIAIDFGYRAKACQFAGSHGALQWTRPHLRENQSGQPFSKTRGVALATLGQRQVGNPRVLARYAPGGLAVARQINGKNCAHSEWDPLTGPHQLVIKRLFAT